MSRLNSPIMPSHETIRKVQLISPLFSTLILFTDTRLDVVFDRGTIDSHFSGYVDQYY